jgi:hypothetical protein
MKKMYVLMALLGLCATTASAQTLLLTENFDYPAGAQLRDHGWNPHSAAATNPQTVAATGLSLGNTVYFGNNIGQAALVNNTGSDENRPFTANRDSGDVYASFLLKTSGAVTADGSGFFFHFVTYSNPTNPDFSAVSTAFRARTYIATGSSAAHFRLGLTFNSATVPSTVGTDLTNDLDTAKTYLVVVKYSFVDGPDNDQVSLFVFEDGDTLRNEPVTPTLGPYGGTAADASILQGVALRQYNADQKVIIDGIYVRDHWLLQPANTSVKDEAFAGQVNIFPNPLSGETLYISSSGDQPMQARLIDLTGRTLLQTTVADGQITLPAQTPGLYLLQLEQQGELAIKKLVIR